MQHQADSLLMRNRDQAPISERDHSTACARQPHLHQHHVAGRCVVGRVCRGCAVGQQQALVAPVVGISHGGVHTHIGGHPSQDDVPDAARVQDKLQICTHSRRFGESFSQAAALHAVTSLTHN